MKKSLSVIFWTIKLVYKLTPLLLIFSILFQITNSILPFLQNFYVSVFIDKIISSIKLDNNSWLKFLIILITIRLLLVIFSYLQKLTTSFQNWHLQKKLPEIFIKKISNLDYQQLESKKIANLITKTKENYNWSTRQMYQTITWLIMDIASLITGIILLLPRYWFLVLVIIISEIPGLLIDKKFLKKDWEDFNNTTEANRNSGWLHSQLSNKKNISELKINNALNFLTKKYIYNLNLYTNCLIKNRKKRIRYDLSLSIILRFISTAICLFVIAFDIRNGFITIGMFSFYSITTQQLGGYFAGLAGAIVDLTQQILHIQNFKLIMELKPIIKNGTLALKSNNPKIEFKNVSFKYPNTKRFIYKNLNLIINPNEEIAIVGENGAGKSTLIKLLCRFYDPTNGEILVNDINLKKYNLNSWYQHIGYLGQDFNTYGNLSLKDNIAIGNPNKKINNKKIIESLKKANANFFKKYKNGLDSLMNQQFNGEEPSTGQWQKIAIARIFYRNSPIMILDEPTASIDAVAESKIFTHIYNEIKNKTLIIVSHRFSTVRNAQRILVIKNGEIIEQGTHQQLIAKKGLYSKSFSLQAQGYK